MTRPRRQPGAKVAARRGAALATCLLALVVAACGPPNAAAAPNFNADKYVLKVDPAVVLAAPGARFEVRAVAFTLEGEPVPLPADLPQWTGDLTYSDAAANPTLATVPTHDGEYTLSVTIKGQTAAAKVIVGPEPAVTSDAVDLRPPTVSANPSWDGPAAAVLVDANEAGVDGQPPKCQDDLVMELAGKASMRRNLIGGCTNRVAVFTANHGALFRCQSGISAGCSSAIGNLWTTQANTLDAQTLPPTVQLPLAIWLRMDTTGSMRPLGIARAREEARLATKVFSRARVGVAFDQVEIQEDDDTDTYGSFSRTDAVSCDAAGGVGGIEAQLGISPRAGYINVVYVTRILNSAGNPTSERGYACDRTASESQAPVIVVSWVSAKDHTLAHELGHQLGFFASATDAPHASIPLDSATGKKPFNTLNLMWPAVDPTSGLTHGELSLGQVYRMNVDTRSWINVGRNAVGAPYRTGDRETCQVKWNQQTVCPRLDRNPEVP